MSESPKIAVITENNGQQTNGVIPASARGVPLRILIVEDHADTLQTLAGLLVNCGYDISTADCTRKALKTVEEKQFDVILSDIDLPDGTGYDVISQAKRTQTLKGVAISGLDGSEDFRRSKKAGFDFHLIKPLDFPELCTILHGFEPLPIALA